MNTTDFEFVVECCRSKDIKEKYVLHSYHSSDHQISCDIGRLASGNSYIPVCYTTLKYVYGYQLLQCGRGLRWKIRF